MYRSLSRVTLLSKGTVKVQAKVQQGEALFGLEERLRVRQWAYSRNLGNLMRSNTVMIFDDV